MSQIQPHCPTCNDPLPRYFDKPGACKCGRCSWGWACEIAYGVTTGDPKGGWEAWSKDAARAAKIVENATRIIMRWRDRSISALLKYEAAVGIVHSSRYKLEMFADAELKKVNINTYDPEPYSADELKQSFQAWQSR